MLLLVLCVFRTMPAAEAARPHHALAMLVLAFLLLCHVSTPYVSFPKNVRRLVVHNPWPAARCDAHLVQDLINVSLGSIGSGVLCSSDLLSAALERALQSTLRGREHRLRRTLFGRAGSAVLCTVSRGII